jgi:putative Mn2+ efflux pump MntP
LSIVSAAAALSPLFSGFAMSFTTMVIIALALAMDAFAVSLSTGVTMTRMHLRHALRMAAFFGFFQALMPIAGWSLGSLAADLIKNFDHWVAFVLLVAVGGKMIWESFELGEDKSDQGQDPHNVYILLTLAFATSIDAAAVGISLSFLNIAIITPSIVIGIITFFISLGGTIIGCKAGDIFGKKIEIGAGIVLIGIGTKILLEHTLFS